MWVPLSKRMCTILEIIPYIWEQKNKKAKKTIKLELIKMRLSGSYSPIVYFKIC